MAERVDLDELARLEEERDFLLKSIEDLDRENEAGDVDPADYDELRNGYVARAADAIRAVDSNQSALDTQRAAVPKRRARALLWLGGVAVFAIVAGVLLAGALGSRGEGGLTGTGSMPDDAQSQCRSESLSKPADGVTCYAKLLKDSPDDVDALTYQGWAMVRSGDITGGSANFDRVVELDPTYADVHVFRASVLKNAGDFAGAQKELDRLYSLNPSPLTVSTLQQMGLDTEIAVGLLPADVAACWKQQQTAIAALYESDPSSGEGDSEKFNSALTDLIAASTCLDTVVKARPDDVNALRFQSLAIGLLGNIASERDAVVKAEAATDSVLALLPDDPTALLLRAIWRDDLGDFDGADADLDALADGRVSPLVSPLAGDPADLRSKVKSDRSAAAAAGPTTVPSPTTTTP